MKLADFKFNPTQVVLKFSDRYSLSIINNGHGKEHNLYEIAPFVNGQMAELPGITNGDTVVGYLSEEEVNAIIKKIVLISGKNPVVEVL